MKKLVEARRALSRSPLRARVVRPSDMSPIPSRRSWPFASVDADDVRILRAEVALGVASERARARRLVGPATDDEPSRARLDRLAALGSVELRGPFVFPEVEDWGEGVH